MCFALKGIGCYLNSDVTQIWTIVEDEGTKRPYLLQGEILKL